MDAKRDSMPPQGFARVMPSARRALKERGLRQEEVEPSGPGGRLLREDVVRHHEAPKAPSAHASPEEEVVPMSPFRRSVRPNSVMFAANYEDGRTAYFVVEGHGRPNDDYLAGPIAKERQEKGELPDGNIRTVKRVR
jgi:hypothetical protein